MILPIVTYGNPILRQKCVSIDSYNPYVEKLIQDMWDTMHHAKGCGLAAPQVGRAIRLFVVDSRSTFESVDAAERRSFFGKDDEGIKAVFINATIIDRVADYWEDEEGCLSIPGLSQTVKRSWSIEIAFYNSDFQKQTRRFEGITARMIQHEYDHTEGILYLDYLKPFTRKRMASKLKKISRGEFRCEYPMQ